MPKQFYVLAALSVLVAVALHIEWRRHRGNLAAIPVRVHVNGTRGKSSVARLLAAILREHGVRVVAKTTGTSPRMVEPDGTEVPVERDGRPNISELIRAVGRARRLGAEAIVFECMAVDPDLQRVAEERIVLPTLTVVTNARLDHTDLQGSDPEDVARSFPVVAGGTLVTADPMVARILGPRVRASGGHVHVASSPVPLEELAGMDYIEHPENVSLALEAARLLGVPRDVALRGIRRARPDPGVASVLDVPGEGGGFTLVNLFAANDSDSTFRALDGVLAMFDLPGPPVLLFTARADRPARSAEFAAALAGESGRHSSVVVWGERTSAVIRRFVRRGVDPDRLVDAGSREPEALTELLGEVLGEARVVVGIGNIIGPGQRWLASLAERIEAEVAA